MKSSSTILRIAAIAVGFSCSGWSAEPSALTQLQNAANGTVHTGVTFDNSPRNQVRAAADTRVQSASTAKSTPTPTPAASQSKPAPATTPPKRK